VEEEQSRSQASQIGLAGELDANDTGPGAAGWLALQALFLK
jgi:hypothetical protein